MRQSLFVTALSVTILSSMVFQPVVSVQLTKEAKIEQLELFQGPTMTLAQLKAQAAAEIEGGERGAAGAMMDVMKKIFNRLFGPDERPPAPPMHEIGANEINVVSANKHSEGGDGAMAMHNPGSDPWIGALPRMGGMKNVLYGQTEADAIATTDGKAKSEGENEGKSESETETETKVET